MSLDRVRNLIRLTATSLDASQTLGRRVVELEAQLAAADRLAEQLRAARTQLAGGTCPNCQAWRKQAEQDRANAVAMQGRLLAAERGHRTVTVRSGA